jgi:hypothetical protein
MRNHVNVHQLVCLANLEAMNAHFIIEGLFQSERLRKLNTLAVSQMTILAVYLLANRTGSFEIQCIGKRGCSSFLS